MKIIRCQTSSGQIEFGALAGSGAIFKLRGGMFATPKVTNKAVNAGKLPAPLQPTPPWASVSKAGDTVTIETEKIGKLTNPVVLET